MMGIKFDLEFWFLLGVGLLILVLIFGAQYGLALAGRPDSVWLMQALGIL